MAAQEFDAALEDARGSAWLLYGVEQVARAKGDAEARAKALAEFAKAWKGEPGMLSLENLWNVHLVADQKRAVREGGTNTSAV